MSSGLLIVSDIHLVGGQFKKLLRHDLLT